MSAGPYFNLDDLNGDTFQQLCAAIVLDQFTALATPYGTPGKDGGIDSTHNGELTNYSDLFDTPIKVQSRHPYELFWVFQAKHTRYEREVDRQSSIIKSFKNEIFDWLENRWDQANPVIPSCFILMTNVKVKVATRKELKKLGLLFEYFDIWDGAKIDAFVSANESIRRTFFSNKDDRCDEMLKQLTSMNKVGQLAFNSLQPAHSIQSTPDSFDMVMAIDELINYEILFTTQNNALAEVLEYGNNKWEGILEWPEITFKASKNGIVNLSTQRSALEELVNLIKLKNVFVYVWSRFIGEVVRKDDSIISFRVHEEYVEQVNKLGESIFNIDDGELEAHKKVDAHLLKLQEDILSSLDSRAYQKAERYLGDFYSARSAYLEKKREHPNTSYPNARRLGDRYVFGWDFLTVWDKIYEDILDIVLKGTHTDQINQRILHMPFGFCSTDILLKNPAEHFRRSFSLVRQLLFVLKNKQKINYLADYLEDYERLCEEASDTEYRVETLKEANQFIQIITEIYHHILALLKRALDEESFIDISKLESFLLLLTSANFHRISDNSAESELSWSHRYEKQKEYHSKLINLREDFYFAWATYLWWKKRNKTDYDFASVSEIINKVEVKSLVSLYEKAKDKDTGWFEWWFRPEPKGRMVVYSSSIDHDIRELLISVLLTRPFEADDISDLQMLESTSSVKTLIDDVGELYEKMKSSTENLKPIEEVVAEISKAQVASNEKFNSKIEKEKKLSDMKMSEILETFQKRMAQSSLEGSLYEIKEGVNKDEVKRWAGTYTLMDKVWFLDNTGYTHYASDMYGTMWADAILNGRVQIITMYLTEVLKTDPEEINFKKFLKFVTGLKKDYCLIVNPRTLPWRLVNSHINYKEFNSLEKTAQYLGNVEIIYEVKKLKKGQAILIPKRSINWNVVRKIDKPTVCLISPESKEGKLLVEKNPDLNLGLKVIVDARESGFVSASNPELIKFYEVMIDENE